MIVIDTSVLIDLEQGNPRTKERLAVLQKQYAGTIMLAAPTIWEYLDGILVNKPNHFEDLREDLRRYRILHTTDESSVLFAKLKHRLKTMGKMMPDMDILIAAIALDFNCTVVTKDKHFSTIKELSVITI